MNEAEKMDEVRRLLTETDLTDAKNLGAASDFTSSFEEEGDLEESVRVASAGQQISSHDGEECDGVLGEIAIDLTRLGHLKSSNSCGNN